MLKFFEFLRGTDQTIEQAWHARNWPTFIKLWLASSVCLALGAFVVIYILGAVSLECYRGYHYIRTGGSDLGGMALSAYVVLLYSQLWNFASAFALVSGAIALVSCVPFMWASEHLQQPMTPEEWRRLIRRLFGQRA